MSQLNIDHAIEIAPRIWWVGHYIPGDDFQCHVYLIEHGDQSVLIDPGSRLTFDNTRRKIAEVIPFSNIRYFICQHQDPDIASVLPEIDGMVTRKDVMVVSHWRAITLLKHYDLKMPFLCVEKNGWRLELGGRILTFIFTPYLHFPGAICTFDETSSTLFSSDLFGGFTESWSLYAKDQGYFESMRHFHEHYMPSQDILIHGLNKLEKYSIQMIAPQHGSIIPEHLVKFMFSQLKNIDCGLYLMTKYSTDVKRLSNLNKMLRQMMNTMVLHRDFSTVAKELVKQVQSLLPVADVEFFSLTESGIFLRFCRDGDFHGTEESPPVECRAFFGLARNHWQNNYQGPFLKMEKPPSGGVFPNHALVIPLFSPDLDVVRSTAILYLREDVQVDEETQMVLGQLSIPLGIGVEREVMYYAVDQERQKFYEKSIRDSLTGLYTRVYVNEMIDRLFDLHDRDANALVVVAGFDIDHFKKVNDTFGHNAGDDVLRSVAQILIGSIRRSDIPVRMGGEEFVVFFIGRLAEKTLMISERIRKTVEALIFEGPMKDHRLTISGGVAFRRQKESLLEVLKRADTALYKAKNGGRNQIYLAETEDGACNK